MLKGGLELTVNHKNCLVLLLCFFWLKESRTNHVYFIYMPEKKKFWHRLNSQNIMALISHSSGKLSFAYCLLLLWWNYLISLTSWDSEQSYGGLCWFCGSAVLACRVPGKTSFGNIYYFKISFIASWVLSQYCNIKKFDILWMFLFSGHSMKVILRCLGLEERFNSAVEGLQ